MVVTATAPTTPRPTPDASRAARRALRVLQVGAFACVLAATPYRQFELDRYTVPKELVLHLTALGAALFCLGAAQRLTVLLVDVLLLTFLGLTFLSTLAATNHWLAFQALGVSLAGAALFWSARAVARAGYRTALLATLAAAAVLGVATALVQAYGLVASPLFSLVRAPGGTFGNRNFVAHLAAIGFPVLLLAALETRRRTGFALATLGVALVAAALFLSRSRAGWLGAGVSGAFLAVEGLWFGRLRHDGRLRARLLPLVSAAAIGIAAAWLLPNRLNWRSDSPYLASLAGMANYREGSGRGRLIQYGNSLRMAAKHPLLGVGPGNWPVQYPRFMDPHDPSFDADDVIPTNPWPSSDWVAMISERGFAAGTLFAVIGLALALSAWMRVRQDRSEAAVIQDLTVVATLIATGVVGAFDAVLLLPVPTLFTWTVVGALTASGQPVREIALEPATCRRWVIAAAVVGSLFVGRAAMRLVAMGMYESGGRSAREWAAQLDPGNYRIHILRALAWRAEGRCARVRFHAEAAQALFPHYPAPRRLLHTCGIRRVSLVTARPAGALHIATDAVGRTP